MIYSQKMLNEKIIEETHIDVDWYCIDKNGFVGIVASAGGMLPTSVVQQLNNPINVIEYFRNLPTISNEVIIENAVTEKLNTMDFKQQEAYLKDVKLMTSKGLYYFDKKELNNYFSFEYFLKARPVKPLKIENLDLIYRNAVIHTVIEIDFNIDTLFFAERVK